MIIMKKQRFLLYPHDAEEERVLALYGSQEFSKRLQEEPNELDYAHEERSKG
jgi:hypothetical protein